MSDSVSSVASALWLYAPPIGGLAAVLSDHWRTRLSRRSGSVPTAEPPPVLLHL